MPLQGPILGRRALPLPPAFLWRGETACRSPKWGVNVHEVGVSVWSLGCEKKIVEPLKMDYLKNKEICISDIQYMDWQKQQHHVAMSDGQASLPPRGHFSGKAGASPPRVGGNRWGHPTPPAIPASGNSWPFLYARFTGFIPQSI